ncbi:twin-arginine translocase TatA/TatE family subunit [Myxococcus sp. MxC21-1]|uniref:Sec-independent protein translocase subunit TatA/TatB n=1 Tax=Myxococcus sp. MxC21-1 TaxID=3041439 RepID=UPI00293015F3|nr:twin-arginine translocase TatA/TatE family subunit [Myxococcus sp. MxC21-1]WNZ60636.1 twin-arginine translocase TatA/TatE family subunit [Myxococcus sp. MxC21-1]
MFNIGAGEMVFILVAALLILGPQRLPELARGIGKFLREFRRQTDEVRNVVEREFYAMDQEIGEPPTAPVRPGTRFAPQPPQAVGARGHPASRHGRRVASGRCGVPSALVAHAGAGNGRAGAS